MKENDVILLLEIPNINQRSIKINYPEESQTKNKKAMPIYLYNLILYCVLVDVIYPKETIISISSLTNNLSAELKKKSFYEYSYRLKEWDFKFEKIMEDNKIFVQLKVPEGINKIQLSSISACQKYFKKKKEQKTVFRKKENYPQIIRDNLKQVEKLVHEGSLKNAIKFIESGGKEGLLNPMGLSKKLNSKIRSRLMGEIHLCRATRFMDMARAKEGETDIIKAIKYFEKDNNRLKIANAKFIESLVLRQQGKMELAKTSANNSLKIIKKYNKSSESCLDSKNLEATILNGTLCIYLILGDFKRVLYQANAGIDKTEECGENTRLLEGFLRLFQANAAIGKNNIGEAIKNFETAIRIAENRKVSKWIQNWIGRYTAELALIDHQWKDSDIELFKNSWFQTWNDGHSFAIKQLLRIMYSCYQNFCNKGHSLNYNNRIYEKFYENFIKSRIILAQIGQIHYNEYHKNNKFKCTANFNQYRSHRNIIETIECLLWNWKHLGLTYRKKL